mmetsp:Transcript_5634/g.13081  ORF Transcript_5634/g.13081 Transcript_5634/m.13081 type:complete len:146 (-) Transcript_5634:1170-1607(-)
MQRVSPVSVNNGSYSIRQVATGLAVMVLGICAVLFVTGSMGGSDLAEKDSDSIKNILPAVHKLTRSMKLDEAFEKDNAHAIVAAFTPFLKSKDDAEIKALKQFDSGALYTAVQKYDEDVKNILKGVNDEAKQLKDFTKAEKDATH